MSTTVGGRISSYAGECRSIAKAVSARSSRRARTPVEREHRSGQLRPALHVEDLERLADLPMRHPLVCESLGLRPPETLPRPPPADLDIVLLTQPVRCVVGGNVGQEEQARAHLLLQRLRFGRSSPFLASESAAAGAELVRAHVVAVPFGLSHLLRDCLDLGPQVLGSLDLGPPCLVRRDDGVHFRRLDAAPRQRGLDRVGILAQRLDIDHSCSK